MRIGTMLLVFAALSGCGEHTKETSPSQYIIGNSSTAGITRKVQAETIRICYSDSSDSAQHRQDTQDGVMQWIDALREISKEPLAKTVELVGSNAPCEAKLYVGNYSPAYTQMGSTPSVHINYQGWYGSQTVTLHELGHAFGLLDTYNGRGGSCRSGQPDSVMCWAKFETLQPDDIDGVRAVFTALRDGTTEGLPGVVEGTIVY